MVSKRDIFQSVDGLTTEVKELATQFKALVDRLDGRDSPSPAKQWYSTNEVAALLGKSPYTVRQHWCGKGRIECEKDPDSGRWRIPAKEVGRLQEGGSLLSESSS